MSQNIKLAYNSTKKIVRISFPFGECFETEKPSQSVMEKAEQKLGLEVNQGNIDFFELFSKRLDETWSLIRVDYMDQTPRRLITVSIGEGARTISELSLSDASDGKSAFNLTIAASANVATNWTHEQVLLNIRKLARDAGYRYGHPAQIKAAYMKACMGDEIKDLAIASEPEVDQKSDKPYKLIAAKSRREIIVSIEKAEALQSKQTLLELIKKCGDAIKNFSSSTGDSYEFYKEEMTSELTSAINGPQCVGAGLPLVLLVSLGAKKKAAKKKKESAPQTKKSKAAKVRIKGNYPGAGKLHFGISENELEAFIQDFDMRIYLDMDEFEPNESWLRSECQSHGIVASPNCWPAIKAALDAEQDLTGMVVAIGRLGTPPKKAYLHLSYKDIQIDDDETKDLRDAQASTMVKAGDKVAVVKYKEKGTKGVNVKGEDMDPPKGEPLMIDIGPGIELKKKGQYYAVIEGQPVWKDGELSISKSYIHEGDINLKSGNVYFNGPAHIKGSIASGATVVVTGDLVVDKSIENALVRCGGSIRVKGGIITSESGRVQARDNIRADYLSNSNIACGGNLEVKTSIMNCSIICGGSVRMNTKTGALIGGSLSCRGDISVARLGLPKGDRTVCQVGLDWRAELSLRVRTSRWEKLKRANEEDRKNLRELLRKSAAQTTAKHKEMKDELQAKLVRQREIMDKIKAKIEEAEALMNWDKEVKILVHDVLSPNVQLTVGGSEVPVSAEMAYVIVTSTRRRGGFVNPIDEDDLAS